MVNKVLAKEKDNLVKNVNVKNVNRLSKVKISQKIERKAQITLCFQKKYWWGKDDDFIIWDTAYGILFAEASKTIPWIEFNISKESFT